MRSYRLDDRLGTGGFGEVYRAELLGDGGFRKPVAIKLLHAHLASRPGQLERLRDEARVLGLLRHPGLVGIDGLVQVHAAEGPTRWAMVLELVDGPPLDTLVSTVGALPDAVVLQIGRDLAATLDAAHNAVIDGQPLALVHRDLKPSNVHLAPDGRVKLLDFGIAVASFDAREAKTAAGGILGTPQYMAPERLIGDDGSESDVFALGATLATLLTGRHPDPAELGRANHDGRIERLLEGLSDAWHARLGPLLAFLPSDRPSARDVDQSFARDLSQTTTDVRGWCRANVPDVAALPGPSTGAVLLEGPAPEASAAPEPASPRNPRTSTATETSAAPRRRRGLGMIWVLLTLVLLAGALAVALLGGGSLLLGTLAAYPGGFAAGCAESLDDQVTRLETTGGPGVPRATDAARAFRTACTDGKVGLLRTALFVSVVDDAVLDGVVTEDEAIALEEAYETSGQSVFE